MCRLAHGRNPEISDDQGMFARCLSFTLPFSCAAFAMLLSSGVRAATVTYTFDSNPELASYRTSSGYGPGLPSSFLSPELDPDGTGFKASFGGNAPAGTFALASPLPSGFLVNIPDARMSSFALEEASPFDSNNHPLAITTSLAITAVSFEWRSYAMPFGNAFIVVSDGMGKTQVFGDDHSMGWQFTDEFGTTYTAGFAAGSAVFETSAPVTAITITAYERRDDGLVGFTDVMWGVGIDDLTFAVVPEPGSSLLAALGITPLLRRRRKD